ncbi:unnamed protein product [Rotaria sp. Silwood1]|nr:unnamed protein product [Rotaria sp. Silwood1]CAF5129868.1 unnamed protein product [Rotaria sp. Silwood1]
MPDDGSADNFTPKEFREPSTDTTINFVEQESLPSLKPVTLNTIVLNIYIKFDRDKRVEALVKKLKEPYPHLPKGPNGEHVSILHQYALESTRDSIDMSNQSERFVYQPNLFVRKNDAFGPWIFNYLLSLLALDYQRDLDSK